MKAKILHLINDQKMGGIMSCLKNWNAPRLKENLKIVIASNTNLSESANIIIIHDSCNWKRLINLFFIRIKNINAKIIIHEHHYSEGFEQYNVPNKFRFHLMLKLSYSLVDRVVAISSAQSEWLQRNRLVSSKKLTLIRQCRFLSDFFAVTPKPIEQTFTLGAYGRFHTQKGFDVLLEAMKLITHLPIKLRIVGEGNDEFKLKQLAQGLNNVEFLGKTDNVPEFLQTCDAVVIPSRWEPMGLVCIEAKAAGKFVIASEVDGLSEQVYNCGVLVPPQDPVKLAQAIASVPQINLQDMGKIGRKSVEGAWEKYLDEWEAFLSQMIK